MNSLYGQSSLDQQYEGMTGAAFYPLIPGYKNVLVGPTVIQMNNVATQISNINFELAALGTSPSVTAGISLGTAAMRCWQRAPMTAATPRACRRDPLTCRRTRAMQGSTCRRATARR